MPGSFVVTNNYSSTSGSLANDLSRVSSLSYNSATRVTYEYAGLGWLVEADLTEPNVYTRLITPPGSVTNPPTAPTYSTAWGGAVRVVATCHQRMEKNDRLA